MKLNEDLSVVSYLNMHTHAADSAHVDVLKVRASIKRKAVETEETPEQILGSQLQGLIQEAAVQMVPICHVRRCIRQVRQKQNAVHPMPLTRSFEIPDELTRLDDGENFLLFDSRAEDVNRILVFGTERTVRLLGESDHSFMDGTFKVVPELFFQLYTIQVLASFYAVIPCLFVLLPNKMEETYRRLFNQVAVLQPLLHPQTISMDFEKAAINAASDCFPNVTVHGCFFHLSQNVYRKVQSLGLQEKYQADKESSLAVRMLPALAFVPSDKVDEAFESLQDPMPAELSELVDYYEDTYIRRLRRRHRADPVFRHDIWNVNSRVVLHE